MPSLGHAALEFEVKAVGQRGILKKVNPKVPTFREANIQIEKLNRMLERFQKRFPSQLLLAEPGAKIDKKQGEYRHRIAQQSKCVDRLVRKTIEETLQQRNPRATAKKVRTDVKKLVEKINSEVYQMFWKHLLTAVRQGIGSELLLRGLKILKD